MWDIATIAALITIVLMVMAWERWDNGGEA